MAPRESLSGDIEVNYRDVILLVHVSIFKNRESSFMRESQWMAVGLIRRGGRESSWWV